MVHFYSIFSFTDIDANLKCQALLYEKIFYWNKAPVIIYNLTLADTVHFSIMSVGVVIG